ncbi:hotdog fold domain-containing protein [Streptomyces sp. NPDC059002]|uniref:hotdog fold domain-containing protein n=1 Tax=Streptomyces sp. NPDC059002 TaxID=3346690 RepID=UPI0036CAA85D
MAADHKTQESDELVVPPIFEGYPGLAFGGYLAGVLADRTPADTVRVDFRAAVPVGRPVRFGELDGGGATLTDASGAALATARPAPALSLDLPDAPTWDEAVAATEAYRAAPPSGVADGSVDCFGCGDRAPDRGLRQHSSPVPGRDVVAAAWAPHPAFDDGTGALRPDLAWAALDCPSAAPGIHFGTLRRGAVTAFLTGRILRPMAIGEDHITYAWLISESGRKHTMGVAATTAKGELCAVGEALWVDPRE